MNRNRMLMLAFVALALSGVVTFLSYRLIRDKLRPADDTANIVVVTQRVSLGMRLTPAQLRMAPWPKAAMCPACFRTSIPP